MSFGDFRLDLDSRALFHGTERVHLTSKPLDVLIMLVEHAGTTVTKSQLMETVWRETFVTEENLTQAILKIRRALGDDPEFPGYVQTIPRVGYRFVCPVIGLSTAPVAEPSASILPHPQRPARSFAWPVAVGVGLVTLILGAMWWAGVRPGGQRDKSARGSAPSLPPVRVPLPTPSSTKPSVAPDGVHFVFVGYRREQPGIGDLYVASLHSNEVRRITHGMDPRGDHPVFTPEGTEVVFARWRSGDDGTRWPDLWITPVDGGSPRILLLQASGAGYSPDGQWVAYTKHLEGTRSLWISGRKNLSRHREVGPLGFTPRWSPDGKWIAYTTSNPEGGPGELWICSADLADRRRLSSEPRQIHGLSWMPDSKSVVASVNQSGEFQVMKFHTRGGAPTVLVAGIGTYSSPSISASGRLMLFSHVEPSRNLYYAEEPGEGRESEITRGQYHVWPALSPDGSRVASAVRTPGFDDMLYITDVRTGNSNRVSDRPAAYPAWFNPQEIGYLSDIEGSGTELRIAAASGGANSRLCTFTDPAAWLAIHPGGHQIAVVLTASNGRQSVIVKDLEGRHEVTLAEGGEYEHLRWVPGGDALSWSGPLKSAGSHSDGIWLAAMNSRRLERLVPDGHGPVWNDDGSCVYYSRIGEHAGLWVFCRKDPIPVRVRVWTESDYFDISARRLVFARISSDTHIFRLPLE